MGDDNIDEKPISDDELFVDPENIEALNAALRPAKNFYPLTLPSGAKIRIPFHVASHAYSMEAGRGERRVKETDKIDPDRERRFFIKRMNRALEDGWQIVDDLDSKTHPSPAESFRQKQIPVSLIQPSDWNTWQEVAFPGFLDELETVRNRADAIRRCASKSVSGPGESELRAD